MMYCYNINCERYNMKHINLKLSRDYQFTEEHLQTLEALRSKEAHPDVYGDTVPGDMKYLRTELVSVDDIDANNKYFVQDVRAGKNPEYDEISEDIKKKGYSLAQLPIQVMEYTGGDKPYYGIEGRTRYDILVNSIGVKNLIVDIYEEADEKSRLEFSFNQNTNKKPHGTASFEDAQVYIENLVKKKYIDVASMTSEDVFCAIRRQLSGMGRRLKPTQLNTIVNNAIGATSGKRLFTSFPNPQDAKTWLKDHGYIDTDDIIYAPVASDMYKFYERIFRLKKNNPGKEVRMIVYSGTLNAKRPIEDWTFRNLEIKQRWDNYRREISEFTFGGAKVEDGNVYAYGTIPQAEGLSMMYPLDKLVIYEKTND